MALSEEQLRQVQANATKPSLVRQPIPAAESLAKTQSESKSSARERWSETTQPKPWGHLDLPPKFRRWKVSDYPASQAVTRFLQDPQCWCLYIYGETDARKTSLATAILRQLRGDRPMQWGHFVPIYDAVRIIRDIESDSCKRHISDWRKSPCLALDDLGKSRDTPHLIEQMLFLLHYRSDWADGEKTIITANMDLKELAKRIDPATARRIEDGTVMKMELRAE